MMWILIDLSYLAHRARHSLGDLSTEDIPTGVMYGFFEQLYAVCSQPRFASNKVVVFADSKRSFRKMSFPDYKKKRHENRSEEEIKQIQIMHQQMDILRTEWLPQMGIPVIRQTGIESDDLIAGASIQITSFNHKGVMVTADGDLYQCITDVVHWYDPQRDLLYDREGFKAAKGVSPIEWMMVKAIGGCSGDGVPGIRGVSEKGAIDYLLERMPTHYKKYTIIRETIESGEINKWIDLVMLPHKKTKPVHLVEPQYNPKAFYKFCDRFDIESYTSEEGRYRWDMFFEGIFPSIPTRRKRRHGKEWKRKLF